MENDLTTMEEEIFRKNLKYYRKKIKMSQIELAKISRIHRTHISALEKGQASPTLKTIIKLARAMEVKTWWLVCDRRTMFSEEYEKVRGFS
jgi:Predicted transcriptional regulators